MLSKSLFIRGLQCPKSLWLKKYHPEVLTQPSSSQIAIFDNGSQIGGLACELFPNGEKIEFNEGGFGDKIHKTAELIANGAKVIYEATFCYDDVLVMVDILVIKEEGVEIYEVKSSTGVKEVYLQDIAIQNYVLRGAGHNVLGSYLVHIDNSYIREGELEISKLFKIVDLSEQIAQIQIQPSLHLLKSTLKDKSNEPCVKIGMHCNYPYECDAKNYCWSIQNKIPSYSVFNLAYLKSSKKFELFFQGLVKIEDLDEKSGFDNGQQIQIMCEKSGQTIINQGQIKKFLNQLSYPIYHLDFETFQQSIPQWNGVSPYRQIPFQYSIHIDYGNGELEHREFLAEVGVDPRYELAQSLVRDIPQGACVLAYNMAFEKGVIANLAKLYDNLSSDLMGIYSSIQDLMEPFKQKYYYSPKMKGSFSIKSVLPALVPEMELAYKQLHLIQNGGDAMEAFACMSQMDKATQEEYRQSLLEYCKLDTLAMVKVLEVLRECVK